MEKFYVELEKRQVELLLNCLDVFLRSEGINGLNGAVEIYNVLNSAKKIQQQPQQKEDPQKESNEKKETKTKRSGS